MFPFIFVVATIILGLMGFVRLITIPDYLGIEPGNATLFINFCILFTVGYILLKVIDVRKIYLNVVMRTAFKLESVWITPIVEQILNSVLMKYPKLCNSIYDFFNSPYDPDYLSLDKRSDAAMLKALIGYFYIAFYLFGTIFLVLLVAI